MSSTMTLRLDDEVKKRLEKLADATQRSKSFLAAEAIRAFVETNEWQMDQSDPAWRVSPRADQFTGEKCLFQAKGGGP